MSQLQSPKRRCRFTMIYIDLHYLRDSGLGALKATPNTVSSTKRSPVLNEAGWQHLSTADSPPAKRCQEEEYGQYMSIRYTKINQEQWNGWYIFHESRTHTFGLFSCQGTLSIFLASKRRMVGLRLRNKTRLHGLCQRSRLASHGNQLAFLV